MKKLWAIFKHEYTRHVLRKRFLIALFSVPLWIGFSIGMGLLSVLLQTNTLPVGYVDQAGIIKRLEFPYQDVGPFNKVTFQPFMSEEDARAALEAKRTQAYFVLPPDFIQNRNVQLVYLEQPDNNVFSQFSTLLRGNLLADWPDEISERIIEGPEIVIEATQEDRQMAENDWFKIAAPIAAGILLIVSVFTSSGYLMQAVVEEKENRTMEILATSLSPEQIMGGKIIALISVGLTQILVWSLFPALFLGLAVAYLPFLQNLSVDWKMIALIFITALPTFVLISALMATIGATITESREGQQVSSLVTLPVMAPFMLMTPIIMNPGGPIALFLSFFPLTASMTLLMRLAFSSVPDWQIYLSTGILIFCAIGALWLAGRVFRLGMLQYGRRLGWKDIAGVFRPKTPLPTPVRSEKF